MMPAPRVLLVNYEFPPIGGGAGTATAGMAAALAMRGCDVVVITARFRGQPAQESTHGYAIRRVPVVRRRADRSTPFEMLTFMVSASLGALRLTRAWRPQLTIAFFGIPGGPVAWLLRVVRGTPYVISMRGGDVPGFDFAPTISLYRRLATPVLRFLWNRAAAVVANGEGLRELAQRAAPGLHVHVIPNGVDAVRHAPALVGELHDPPRILLVGRLTYQKALDVVLHALTQLGNHDFQCDIIGDGPDRAALEELARTLRLNDRVHFHGWVMRDELPMRYNAADIFVLTSRMEGMPNVVLEAMAHALAIVATDVPGTRELVIDGRTGLLIPVADERALADALVKLLDDGALRRRLGDAARHRVLEQFTWEGVAAAYLRVGGLTLPATVASAAPPRTAGAR